MNEFQGMKISPKGTSMWPFLKEGRDSVLVVPDMPKKYDIAKKEKNGVFDSKFISSHAKKFSTENFIENLKSAVNRTLQEIN